MVDITTNKHFDIGIYGWWGHENFGGCLTYFALEKVLKKLGYSVLMIQEADGLPGRYKIPDACIAMTFAKEHYDYSQQVNVKDLYKFNDICDKFFVGGDQLWNNQIPFVKEDCFLNFIDDKKLKLSYSTSFGTSAHNPSQEYLNTMKPLLKRFDAVSVREDYGVETADRLYGVKAEQVIDSVFLLDKEEYVSCAVKGDVQLPEKYLFAFILNPTKEKRYQIEAIAEKLKLEIVCIPDAAKGHHENFNKIFDGLEIVKSLSINNFLKAYANASYIVTDSFHGTCMSYIFKKDFSVYFNEVRGADRFRSLMRLLKLYSRRIFENSSKEEILYNENIGFNTKWEEADTNVKIECEHSLTWLKKALEIPKPKIISKAHYGQTSYLNKNNEPYYICKKGDCTGCSACYNVCPTGAITMEEDNEGFLYPQLTFKDKCINCGKCFRICPVLNPSEKMNANLKPKNIYAAYSLDKDIRFMSSSGGAFSEFAKYALENGGVVYGAAYADNFDLHHIKIDSMDGLKKLRQSKYYQSESGEIFKDILKELKINKYVVFCGTPCQCGGLNAFLGGNASKKYPNLVIIDFICHSVPTKKAFKSYLKELESDYKAKAKNVYFKNKQHSWTNLCLRINFFNKERYYIKSVGKDNYFKAYLNYRLFLRPSCHNCQFKDCHRDADITLADFWGLNWNDKNNPDSKVKGVSLIMIYTEKAQCIFDSVVSKNMYFELHTLEDAIKQNGSFKYNDKCGMYRDYFFENVDKYKFSEIIKNMEEREAMLAKQRAEQQKIPQIIGKVTKIGNVVIDMKPGSKIIVEDGGELILNYNLPKGSNKETIIMMYENSTIRVKGKFLVAFDSTIKVFGGSHIIFNNGFVNSGAKISAQVNGINFGNDFLGGPEIIVFDYDSHKIVDLETQKVLNPPEPELKIGEHVWLCARAAIFGGVNIGKNSIIAANTVITKDVAENSLVAGSPAKVVKTGITWKK